MILVFIVTEVYSLNKSEIALERKLTLIRPTTIVTNILKSELIRHMNNSVVLWPSASREAIVTFVEVVKSRKDEAKHTNGVGNVGIVLLLTGI